MYIRIRLSRELVSRLDVDPIERDKQIQSAIERYLTIPILEPRAKPPQRTRKNHWWWPRARAKAAGFLLDKKKPP